MNKEIIDERVKAELKSRIEVVLKDYQNGNIEDKIIAEIKQEEFAQKIQNRYKENNIFNFFKYRFFVTEKFYNLISDKDIRVEILKDDESTRWSIITFLVYCVIFVLAFLVFKETSIFLLMYFCMFTSPIVSIVVNLLLKRRTWLTFIFIFVTSILVIIGLYEVLPYFSKDVNVVVLITLCSVCFNFVFYLVVSLFMGELDKHNITPKSPWILY